MTSMQSWRDLACHSALQPSSRTICCKLLAQEVGMDAAGSIERSKIDEVG